MNPPYRQIRAAYDEESITVYQAYDPALADPAVAAQRFVAPFKRERMTWIKPSFLWMMYRCGWATKPGQTRVLAIALTHEGFAWALAHSCLSHPDASSSSSPSPVANPGPSPSFSPGPGPSAGPHSRPAGGAGGLGSSAHPAGAAVTRADDRAGRVGQEIGRREWAERLRRSPVRIQWDPERDPHHNALPYRSIQIGLSGEAVTRYIEEWTLSITDVTERVHDLHTALRAGQDIAPRLPVERAYALSDDLARTIGATRP
ncbi:DUF4291 domain-containing protein [Nonomuraea sp. ZG12]|uniref:DUF4291 domain-containing protein n=1 Tax=Nonomuraea sp. ZG12 TaxID=3452207 RepID=UPI003F890FAC